MPTNKVMPTSMTTSIRPHAFLAGSLSVTVLREMTGLATSDPPEERLREDPRHLLERLPKPLPRASRIARRSDALVRKSKPRFKG